MQSGTNLGDFILGQTKRFGGKSAFIQKDAGGIRRPVSFNEFNAKVLSTSQFLKTTYGSKNPRFKIGLWGENRMEWCALAIAIWHAGGILVPLMHIATEEEVKRIIAAARLDGLFVSEGIIKSHHLNVKALGVNDVRLMDFHQMPLPEKGQASPAETSTDDLAVLIFTSGTTGHPKGVMLTHGNLITNIQDTVNVVPCDETDRAVSVLPLSHMFELIAGFAITHVKGITISYPDSLKPEDVLSEMRALKATMMAAVPLLFEIMDRTIQEKIGQLPTSVQHLLKKAGPVVRRHPALGKIIFKKVHQVFGGHVRYFFTGGAKIDPEIILRFQSLGIQMLQGYGLTETSPIISFTTVDSRKYTSVGKAVKALQIKIDQPSSEGEGEICVKGPSVFKGYFENVEATAEAFKDGWFHTGDLGHLDEEGYIYITGRKKDMIVTPNGKNVYPEELEEILKASTKFLEVSVLGMESGRGETVHAVIVPASKDPAESTKEKIWEEINRLTAGISEYKKIQGLTLAFEELPKTPTKKVRKHLVRAMIKEGKFDSQGFAGAATAGQKTPLDEDSERQEWLRQKLIQITKKPDIWREAELKQDLGIDSLTFMEIISQIESHWGSRVPDEDFEKLKTVQDLVVRLENPTEVQNGTADAGAAPQPVQNKTPFDFKKNNSFLMNGMRFLIHGLIIRPLLKIFFRYAVKNNRFFTENKNFILTPNHSSHFDLLTILSSVPLTRLKNTYAVAAEDYFFNTPFKALFVRLFFNAIPFDRKARVEKGFKICEDILRNGGSLVIFPEGTRALDGKLASFKPGVGRLLAGQPYTAVPSYIDGAYQVFPKGALFPRLRPLSVRFGKPMEFKNLGSDLRSYQQVASVLQTAVEQLRDHTV